MKRFSSIRRRTNTSSASTNNLDESGCPLDLLVNKTIDFAYRGVRLKFDVSHALFSSFDIDVGTRLLLKEVAHEPGIVGARRLLDAGCGTGVIGISLAASCPDMDVVMRDRDFRAVAFAARNAARNGLAVALYGYDGIQRELCRKRRFSKVRVKERLAGPLRAETGLLCEPDARGPYDAVVSNLPAKAGPAVLARYFEAVRTRLVRPGGTFAFVVVEPLAEQARAWCTEAGLRLTRTVATKNHMVAITEVPEEPPLAEPETDAGRWFVPYLRARSQKRIAGADLAWDGIQGLPEFDEPSYATNCALALARRAFSGLLVRRALVIEPGVGIAPLWMRAVVGPQEIVLKSHDLLALVASLHNLESTGFLGVTLVPEPDFPVAAQSQEVPTNETEERLDRLSPSSVSTSLQPSMSLPRPLDAASIDAVILFLEDVPTFDSACYYWPLISRVLKRGGVVLIVGESTKTERAVRQKPPGFSKYPFVERKKGWEAVAFRYD